MPAAQYVVMLVSPAILQCLSATSFSVPPFTYAVDNETYSGWEYKIMSAISTSLNFKLNIKAKGKNIDELVNINRCILERGQIIIFSCAATL